MRRIEALTGPAALAYVEAQEETLRTAATLLKTSPAGLTQRLEQMIEERRKLERELTDTRKKLASGGGGSGAETKEVGGIKFASRLLEDVPPRDLKPLADELKAKIGSGVVALIANNEGKGSIVVGVTQDLTDRLSAVDLVRAGSEALGGKGGGGRPDMAQAGGPDGAAGGKALAAIEAALSA